ncbi:MAG: uracil-DNA glycosylase [Planctomycetota bacterium]
MTGKRAVAQLLQHLSAAGVTHVPKVDLQRRSPAAVADAAASPPGSSRAAGARPQSLAAAAAETIGGPAAVRGDSRTARTAPRPKPLRRASGLMAADELNASAVRVPERLPQVDAVLAGAHETPSEREAALCALRGVVAACQRCSELAGRRRQTVFGVGSVTARILLLGEAPGQEEDETGQPFVGAAGQLLDRILVASQLRREDLYICNVLRCRPPGNRTPHPQEAANCREFLDAQIQVVDPQYIICLGAVAAQNLLGATTPIGKMRGQFYEYGSARVLCTYHPSYLLRNSEAKKFVWDDMKFFMKELGVELK